MDFVLLAIVSPVESRPRFSHLRLMRPGGITNVTISLSSTDNELGGTGVKQIQWSMGGAQMGSSIISGAPPPCRFRRRNQDFDLLWLGQCGEPGSFEDAHSSY